MSKHLSVTSRWPVRTLHTNRQASLVAGPGEGSGSCVSEPGVERSRHPIAGTSEIAKKMIKCQTSKQRFMHPPVVQLREVITRLYKQNGLGSWVGSLQQVYAKPRYPAALLEISVERDQFRRVM